MHLNTPVTSRARPSDRPNERTRSATRADRMRRSFQCCTVRAKACRSSEKRLLNAADVLSFSGTLMVIVMFEYTWALLLEVLQARSFSQVRSLELQDDKQDESPQQKVGQIQRHMLGGLVFWDSLKSCLLKIWAAPCGRSDWLRHCGSWLWWQVLGDLRATWIGGTLLAKGFLDHSSLSGSIEWCVLQGGTPPKSS